MDRTGGQRQNGPRRGASISVAGAFLEEMSMRLFLVASMFTVLLASSTKAQESYCQRRALDEKDWEALSQTTAELTQAKFAALDDPARQKVCLTRAVLDAIRRTRQFDASLGAGYSYTYLKAKPSQGEATWEQDLVRGALNAFLQKQVERIRGQ
jgi:hypothetical protein